MTVLHEIIAPKSNADNAVLVRKLYFFNKEKVNKYDELLELETSKTAIIIDAPGEGYVEYLVNPGDSVDIGMVVIRIHDSVKGIADSLEVSELSYGNFNDDNKIFSKKAAAYLNTHKIKHTNLKKHFITLKDVSDGALNSINESGINDTSDVTLSLSKINEINALTAVQSSGIVSTVFVNVSAHKFSHDYKTNIFKESQAYLPIIVFEVSRLLRKFSLLNSFYSENVIKVYKQVNIGVAFDIDDGLKVYTINNTNKMSLEEVERDICSGIDSYLEKKLTPEQISNSTFTITDLSSYGVDSVIPLINCKQSAILGISSIDRKLNRFCLSLSFDHRVTEGKIASQFLIELKDRIDAHSSLLSVNNDTNIKCGKCMKTLYEDKELSGVGMVMAVDHNGDNSYVCQTCLDGW
jgi:pyruvate/2-oxoglutarate dehydrogenase complex dihydrolipoamide acyltransferase (E2) component